MFFRGCAVDVVVERRGSSSANSGNKLVIRKAADGGTEVAGLTRFPIDTGDWHENVVCAGV